MRLVDPVVTKVAATPPRPLPNYLQPRKAGPNPNAGGELLEAWSKNWKLRLEA